MRAVLSSLALPEVEVIEGFAESVPLGDSIAEVVVSGSSFHWFDLDNALAEAARLLTSGGTLAFAWNHPDVSVGWVRRMSDAMLLRRPWRGDRPWSELVPASGLFGPVEQAEFTHVCSWPRSVLADYVRSYSAVGVLAAPEREKVVGRVEAALRAEPELAHADELHIPFRINAYRARTLG